MQYGFSKIDFHRCRHLVYNLKEEALTIMNESVSFCDIEGMDCDLISMENFVLVMLSFSLLAENKLHD